jgi:hypothetical protein
LVALENGLGEMGGFDHNPEQHTPPRPTSISTPNHPGKPPHQGLIIIVVALEAAGGFVRRGADDETGGEGGLAAGVKKGGPMHKGQRLHKGSGGWLRFSQHGGKPSNWFGDWCGAGGLAERGEDGAAHEFDKRGEIAGPEIYRPSFPQGTGIFPEGKRVSPK